MTSPSYYFYVSSKQGQRLFDIVIRAKNFKGALSKWKRFEQWVSNLFELRKRGIRVSIIFDGGPLRESRRTEEISYHPKEWGSISVRQMTYCPECGVVFFSNIFHIKPISRCSCGRLRRECIFKHCDRCDSRVECLTIS
jgi:hypothetical protein